MLSWCWHNSLEPNWTSSIICVIVPADKVRRGHGNGEHPSVRVFAPPPVCPWFPNIISIAWIRAVRHRTAVPHSSYHLLCMLKWSLSGHCSVWINHPTHNFKELLRNTLNRRHLHLYQYVSYKLLSSFKRAWICLPILVVPFNLYFEINENNCCWYWDPLLETGSLWKQGKHKLNPMQTEVGQ